MEQRALRLGDIVDDYCPRERRITNHAIVAIVEDAIRQTRCTTCDADHVYKQAREPLRRRKDAPALVAGGTSPAEVPAAAIEGDSPGDEPDVVMSVSPTSTAEVVDEMVAAASESEPLPGDSSGPDEGWVSHRRLIRASLPRIEGEPTTPRPIPEFTMHQRPAGRSGQGFRFQGRHGTGSGGGNGAGRDFNRGRGPQPERNGNHANGNATGSGRGGPRHGHGKRSR